MRLRSRLSSPIPREARSPVALLLAPRVVTLAALGSPAPSALIFSLCALCSLRSLQSSFRSPPVELTARFLQRVTADELNSPRNSSNLLGQAGCRVVGMPPSKTAATLNRLTSSVLDAAIRIHRALGPGMLESAYLTCLEYEMTEERLEFERQKSVPLVYKGVTINCGYRADLGVDRSVLIEVKAVEALAPIHFQQLQRTA